MHRLHLRAAVAAVALALAAPGALAAQRVFVASTGNDANAATGCLFTLPCRSFAAAMTQVDPGGEVVALDAAGYGAVTIAKSVTITANPGFHAGIAAATGAAVSIAGTDIAVTLRGLALNGVGANYGVHMTDGARLTIENCVVSGFAENGVLVDAPVAVRIIDTVVRGTTGGNGDGIYLRRGVKGSLSRVRMAGNFRSGLLVEDGNATSTTRVSLGEGDVSGNNYGAVALSSFSGGTAILTVARSTLSNNGAAGALAVNDAEPIGPSGAILGITRTTLSANAGVGLDNQGTAVESGNDNFIRGNGTDISGPITGLGGI